MELDQAVEILKALGDPTRFKIIKILSESSNNLCVTALAEHLKISQPVISQHLKILKNAKLVIPNRNGYHIHYSINLALLSTLIVQLQNFLEITDSTNIRKSCLS